MRFTRAAALAVGLTTLGSTSPAPAHASGWTNRQDRVERSIISRLNAIRAQSGIRRLRFSRGLERAADAQSSAIAGGAGFAHGDVRGRVSRFVHATSIGETLAWVSPEEGSNPDAVVGAWMASPTHRATLLSAQFSRIGIARRRGTVAGRAAVVFTVDVASAR